MIQKLEYFLKVAELKSFRKAADELFVSQPALSTSIARLESELGVKLLQRNSKSVSITEIGQAMIPDMESICTHYHKILNITADYQNAFSSRAIRFGTGIRHAVLIAGRHMERYPSCNLALSQFSSYQELKEALLDGVIDFCLCSPPVEDDNIESAVIMNERLCVLMNRSHLFAERSSLCLRELSDQHILKLPLPHPFNIQLSRIYAAARVQEPLCIMHTDPDAAALFISSPAGASSVIIQPISRCREFSRDDPNLTYVPLSDSFCYRPIGISWLKGMELPKGFPNFMESAAIFYSASDFQP